MQNREELKEKIFFESKSILETVSKIASIEELMLKKGLVEDLLERISFLKILDKNESFFEIKNEIIEESSIETHSKDQPTSQDLEEEVIFTNELNNTETEPIIIQEEISQQLDNDKQTDEIDRRKIIDIERNSIEIKPSESAEEIENSAEVLDNGKKFRLANIKGLKAVQSLFDDDPLEDIVESASEKQLFDDQLIPETSLLKNNVPTDFMEAETPKPDFRLDLNDKIAFTKELFQGSQSDLNDAVRKLNSFSKVEEAKEYLSELYYERNWKKADEYAQRLWTLVENKFL